MKRVTGTGLVVVLLSTLGACATQSTGTNAQRLDALGPYGAGAFVHHVGERPMDPCSLFAVTYREMETGGTVEVRTNHGGLSIMRQAKLVGAEPGLYSPVEATCVSLHSNSQYDTTTEATWMVDASLMEPIVVVPGKVTVVNDLIFRARDGETVMVAATARPSREIEDLLADSPQYEFVGN